MVFFAGADPRASVIAALVVAVASLILGFVLLHPTAVSVDAVLRWVFCNVMEHEKYL